MRQPKRNSEKRFYKLLVSAAFVLLIFFCTDIRTEAATPYKTNGKLSVKNNRIVNAKGKTFVIKGVSTHGLAWFPEYVNKTAFRTLRDQWGANTVRLALYTAEYNGYCSGGDQKQLKALIDKGVRYASDLGMYVIIDWHILSDGNPLTYKKQAISFFKETAKKYAGSGNVLYEICNEPNGSGGSWKNIKSYASSVISTIRSVNKDAVIIVGTPTWSQDVDQAQASPLKGYQNIAYAFHFYAGTHKADMRSKLEKVLKKGLPVIVTEFGISEASGSGTVSTKEGNLWIKLLDKYNVGRVCWNLSNKDETSALLKSTSRKTGNWTASDLSASGRWLVQSYTGKAPAQSGSVKPTATPRPTATPKPTPTPAVQKKSAVSSGKVKIKATVTKVGGWKNGGSYFAQYRLVLKNTGARASKTWKVSVKFGKTIQFSDNWCAKYSKSGTVLTAKPLSWNKALKKNEVTELGFIVKSSKEPALKSVSITAG